LPDVQAKCYVFINKYNIAAVVLADDQYPERIAFMIINQMLKEFTSNF
jgi:synaptobrevin family protein YKT6